MKTEIGKRSASYSNIVLNFFAPEILAQDIQGSDTPPTLLEPAPFRAQITNLTFPNLTIDGSRYSASMHFVGTFSPRRYTIGLNQTIGPNPFKLFGSDWEIFQVVLFKPGDELDALTPANAAYLAVTIPEDYFEQKVRPLLTPEAQSRIANSDRMVSTPECLRRYRSLLAAIHHFGLKGNIGQLPINSLLNMEDMTIQALVDLWNFALPNSRRSTANSTRTARKTHTYMHEHNAEKIMLGDISNALGFSKRTIHYAFLDIYGITPMRYLRLLRLSKAHSQLLEADPMTTTVTEIATKTGFWHFGNFSRYYKNTFGKMPSQTLQRAATVHY